MSGFHLPVILPPKLKDLVGYYSGIEAEGVTVTAGGAPGPGLPFEIVVGGADVLHDDGENPMSTVFAVTGGFVTWEQGSLVLRVWLGDFDDLDKPAGGLRPNRIVFGLLDPASVEAAMQLLVEEMSLPVLVESWREDGGTGNVPARETLEEKHLERFMAGTAAIFVPGGTPLGLGSDPTGTGTVARLTLRTFFDAAGPALPVEIPAEELIDNALLITRLPKFAGHPLVKAIGALINVRFRSRFLIWDNTLFDYVPLAHTDVTLFAGAPVPVEIADFIPSVEGPTFRTDAAGRIDEIVPLPGRAMIRWRYATANHTYGSRLYTTDVRTNAHKARLHLNPLFENTKDYRAKYEIYPGYQEFINDLVEDRENDVLFEDRGNAGLQDRADLTSIASTLLNAAGETFFGITVEPTVAFSQLDLLRQIAAFESAYKADVVPPKPQTFNLLVEGDSWLNYPLAFNDIYGQLDQIFRARLKPGIAYNRIPLQHSGDRSYHMFHSVPGKVRQWSFTQDFLREYPIDLILCSAGGNDIAAPGFSNGTELEPYDGYFTDGYFDPYLAQQSLSPAEMATAQRLMAQSFAVLLNNHRWNFFIQGKSGAPLGEAAMTAALDPLLQALGFMGPSLAGQQALGATSSGQVSNNDAPSILQPIANAVIANFPDPPNAAAKALLNAVFDQGLFAARYAEVMTAWTTLLNATPNIPVITHTYGYPLFSEHPASPLGWGNTEITGPWFHHRFHEAAIADRRIRKLCLKAILDHFLHHILEVLKANPSYSARFDWVDIRNLNSSTDVWRDEMHLRARGYEKIAEKIYASVAANPQLSHFFV